MARSDRFSGDSGSGIRAGSMGRARREDAMIAKWQRRGQERKDISVFSECFSCQLMLLPVAANMLIEVTPSHILRDAPRDALT